MDKINENERLKEHWELQLLDTPPEKSYEDITRLAAFICDTPISLVTLLDEKRQFFKYFTIPKLGKNQNKNA